MNNELDFLNEVLNFKEDKKCMTFPFFKSNFHENIWNFDFGDNQTTTINFEVKLSDGFLLTDKKHEDKINILKEWIVESLLDKNMYLNSIKTIKSRVFSILNIFDYINSSDLRQKFSKYGFAYFDYNYWVSLLTSYSLSNDVTERFNVDVKILNFYNEQNNTKYNNLKNLSSDELKSIRDFFKTNKISINLLNENMLVKRRAFPKILQEKKGFLYQEFNGYFRNNEDTIMSEITLNNYKDALKILVVLYETANKHKKIINVDDLKRAIEFNYTTVGKKRFETYPSKYIFEILKQAIEFHYLYGESIVSRYIEYIEKNEKPSIISFGKNPENYFSRIRNHESDHHLLRIYYGAVQFVIGALMARRQSELQNLKAFECLDQTNTFLLFNRAKSTKGLHGFRDIYKLPVDEVVVDMIKKLQKIHMACNHHGFLFNVPNPSTHKIPLTHDRDQYNNRLDMFFDYIEAPLIDNKRLYIRQHQLRRFFAMSFFWGSGYGSLNTLRWFLGHTDVKHVYNYITESVSGSVLNNVKSQYIAENIHEYDNLFELIKSKYHTENISLLDTNTLTEYINELLDQNIIEIEPDFLIDDSKNQYKIIVKIKDI
ncbi:hypothetical protein [Serratia sp. Se-RSBMAAmG]|uniref:hypothetical protein n=1 Tax=Serratia sp. Se-RSBMAAmG TaxID=3043305 RepID=UPI0024AF9EAD|nr:hypothetical protein [Serratia sp. Se-RSBMAAmG]MDI6976229.1 hypothetical protein [Serratia sp. Se-RSBMAAmG]